MQLITPLMIATSLVVVDSFSIPNTHPVKLRLPRSGQRLNGPAPLISGVNTLGAITRPIDSAGFALLEHVTPGGTAFPILKLWGLCSLCGSVAFVKKAYAFSLAYGLSTLVAGLAGMATTAKESNILALLHSGGIVLYGVKMVVFLCQRVNKGEGYKRRFRALDKTPQFNRLPLIMSTSLFCEYFLYFSII